MSDLVGNPEDRFSHNVAQRLMDVVQALPNALVVAKNADMSHKHMLFRKNSNKIYKYVFYNVH